MFWYPAPNLDRALAPSWDSRFCCLTQELVTRLNFGSAYAQVAAPAAHPLAHLLSQCCLEASVSLHPYSVPLLSPCYYWQTMSYPQLPSFRIFCQLFAKVWRPIFGNSGGMAYWILIHDASEPVLYICPFNIVIFDAVDHFISSFSISTLSPQYLVLLSLFCVHFYSDFYSLPPLSLHVGSYFVSILLLINPNSLSNDEKENCRRDLSVTLKKRGSEKDTKR